MHAVTTTHTSQAVWTKATAIEIATIALSTISATLQEIKSAHRELGKDAEVLAQMELQQGGRFDFATNEQDALTGNTHEEKDERILG